ncbi:hypothetical protein [Novosphingobium panipatense]|uniref:Uncharacterized protein n=1 Tax=Novosphingobium panipatense TaxID=428991 RepID=A0ABY1Q3U0_9SPHN|nr:hypothetical protein [Novosphingobium panipatense]SMP58522.1 hypothetical protein SAMN06296065_102488 [Novosphingobium panipatense]
MTAYRYNRPTTAFLALTFPVWATATAAFYGLKEAWKERHYIARELKDALAYSFEPVTEAWGGLKAWVADKVETSKLYAMIGWDRIKAVYRAQIEQRLIALLVLFLAFPFALAAWAVLSVISAIEDRSFYPIVRAGKEVRWFLEDFVDVMKTGEA